MGSSALQSPESILQGAFVLCEPGVQGSELVGLREELCWEIFACGAGGGGGVGVGGAGGGGPRV